MPPCRGPGRPGAPGFTLIELLVALVIAALLAAVAYPTYAAYAQRTYRAAAAACLQAVAHQMERRYTTDLAYDASAGLPTPACVAELASRYAFGFAAGQPTAAGYALEATPAGRQADDATCGTLRLSHTGLREVTGSGDVQSCWR